jgi:hypothetical protein
MRRLTFAELPQVLVRDANKKVQQKNVVRAGTHLHPQTSSMVLHLKESNEEKNKN